MSTYRDYLFFLIAIFMSQYVVAEQMSTDIFHICTVASHKTSGLKKLLNSCKQQGIEITILGLGLPYRGNGQKLTYVRDYVDTLPEDHIVLFVDGYDTLILADKETILKKFLSFNAPFVISTETNCWPFEHLADNYPESPTPYRYINSGVFMGYAGAIQNLLNTIQISQRRGDQGQLTECFCKNPDLFCLDYFAELALSLFLVNDDDVEIDEKTKSVRSRVTGSYPCVIHDNGPSKNSIYKNVYKLYLDIDYEPLIKTLVANNPGQLSVREYSLIAETLIQKKPCNMLVFGVGRDSALWIDLNRGGTTIFLEDNEEWLQYAQKQSPDLQAHLIHYDTKRSQWKELLDSDHSKTLHMDLPKIVSDTIWDIIFVDGPTGQYNKDPGRMKSIYMASQLAQQHGNHVDVFVHDCDRVVENSYCTRFLGKENLQGSVDRLRLYSKDGQE